MTTVVFKDGVLACDSLVVDGNQKLLTPTQKIFKVKHLVAAICGDYEQAFDAAMYLLNTELKKHYVKPKNPDFEVWVFNKETHESKTYRNQVKTGHEIQSPCSMGSGSDFAMGALLSGVCCKRAIEIAATLDTTTDKNIRVVRLWKLQNKKYKK